MRIFVLCFFILTFCTTKKIYAQSLLLNGESGTFLNTDGPIFDNYSVDISNCTSIYFTMNFTTNGSVWTASASGSSALEAMNDPNCPDLN